MIFQGEEDSLCNDTLFLVTQTLSKLHEDHTNLNKNPQLFSCIV